MFQGLRKMYLRNGLKVGVDKGIGLFSKKQNYVCLCSLTAKRVLSVPKNSLERKKPKEILFNPSQIKNKFRAVTNTNLKEYV